MEEFGQQNQKPVERSSVAGENRGLEISKNQILPRGATPKLLCGPNSERLQIGPRKRPLQQQYDNNKLVDELPCDSLRRSLAEAQEIMNAEDVHGIHHQVHGGPGEHPLQGIPAESVTTNNHQEKSPEIRRDHDLNPGDIVEYCSPTLGKWIKAKVVQLNKDGTVDLDLPDARPIEVLQKLPKRSVATTDYPDVKSLHCIENEVEEESLIGATTEKVRVRVALDSGAVANVINPGSLPSDAKPTPNADDTHFVGAGGGRIRKYGTYTSKLESEHGAVGCNWQVADVIRPLHSISTIAGPEEGPGLQDVLFNNKRCVVVPPGVVERILKEIQPIAQYDRCGNLYIAEMEMSSFGRRGQES